ncbi:sodium:solute symporter family protein [Amycolatopsis alkalitolerans]|uniref:Sodium:solute symporter family protein n=1 Tax=Amycolatopsis alkalitolerans TaxID=2547244 RepID=A0A5C4M4Z0_9PSEU|nr:sodium:solute symporter family protein [Amycolatopsis alkalitolerans]TNC26446.1 sodium:solute symporter family protein [Amycolatopsis alkalitolerans]
MTAILIALFVVAFTTGASTALARRRRRMDLTEWAVGGRSFGSFLLWFLSAGEIYTTFAFLGAAGWAYEHGAPGFYVLANAPLGYVLGYWLLPKIWRAGHEHGVLSQGDYLRARFGTQWLATLVAVIGVLALVPYVQVQLTGLSSIVNVLFHGTVSKPLAVGIGAVVLVVFTFTAGLRSSALASVVKDVLVIAAVVAIVVTIGAATGLGGIAGIFRHMDALHPSYANLPGMKPATGHTSLWFMSALLMTNIGYWMWPHSFQANLAAKDAHTVRRNAVFQPLYTLSYFFVFVIGFAAVLTLPHLTTSNNALVSVVAKYYPQWFVGLVAATGVLVAVVPSTVMLLTLGTSVARNIYRPSARLGDRHRLWAGRLATLLGVLAAADLTLGSNKTIVGLLLIAYSGIAQIGPGIIASLAWRRTTTWGVAAGSVTGVVLIAVPQISTWWHRVSTMEIGFAALLVNGLVVVVVSLVTRAPAREHIAVGLPDAPEAVPVPATSAPAGRDSV